MRAALEVAADSAAGEAREPRALCGQLLALLAASKTDVLAAVDEAMAQQAPSAGALSHRSCRGEDAVHQQPNSSFDVEMDVGGGPCLS